MLTREQIEGVHRALAKPYGATWIVTSNDPPEMVDVAHLALMALQALDTANDAALGRAVREWIGEDTADALSVHAKAMTECGKPATAKLYAIMSDVLRAEEAKAPHA